MRSSLATVLGASALILATAVSSATAENGPTKIRFGLLQSIPTDDLDAAGQTTELDDATGVHVGVEFALTDLFRVEPGLSYSKHDITVEQPGFPTLDFGEVTWTALTVNANFHLLRERSFDLYVGATIGEVFWSSVESDVLPNDISTDDAFVIGVTAGIDVPLRESPWAFAAALSCLPTELEIEGGADIGVDPIQLKLGLSYTF